MLDISVVIVSFNTKKLTIETIESVLKEKGELKTEIIVIDNDSKDGSVESLRAYARKNKNFTLIENKKNTGFAFANNQGLRIAKGKYIFLLNSDTIVKKGAMQKLVKFAEKNPDAGVIGPKLFNGDGSIQSSVLRFPTVKNAILQYWFGKKGLFDKYAPETHDAALVDSVVGAAFLITPSAIKKVGLLDEKYFFYFEDIDYCKRIHKAGLKVFYLPQAEIIHYHGASGKKVADPANQWRRLIPGSLRYHGVVKHYVLFLIMWIGQKWQKMFS